VVPGYEVLELLGEGGMGLVYKARQVRLDRIVALKILCDGGYARADTLARFRTEAEAIARLQHPNIVQVFEVGEYDGRPFLAMEFCSGGGLDRKLGGTPLPPQEAASLVRTLGQATEAAHRARVVHRDLKPANILLSADGTPKISDFGLARKLDEEGQTQTGSVMGTPSYMAPEQARAEATVGPAADVYALGAILYELLTGQPPFRGSTTHHTIQQVLNEEPAAPRRLNRNVPRDLEAICLTCLKKEQSRRYATAADLAEDLRRFQVGEPVAARWVGELERGWRWCRRYPAMAASLAGIALLLVSIAVVSTVLGQQAWQSAGKERLARLEAVAARKDAFQKAQDEEAARKETDAEEKKSWERLYASQLALVQSYWKEGNLLAARDKLDEVREHRDTWEYRYLYNLLNHRGQRTFLGHANGVTAVAFNPDGTRLASGSNDQTVKVWDIATGMEVLSLTQHTGAATSVCWSRDGNQLVSGSSDKTVRVWDAHTGRQLRVLTGHTGSVTSVCFSPDDKRIASSSQDRTVKVWDAQNGQQLHSLQGHKDEVSSVAFSPDGKRIASASEDKTLKVWDAHTVELGKPLRDIPEV